MSKLPDIQKSTDGFPKIPINKVGVRNIVVPLKIRNYNGEIFSTIANISSYCNLNENLKGINMSRITRTINDVIGDGKEIGFASLEKFVYKLKEAHGADDVYIKASFDYIYESHSPITHILSYEPVEVSFESHLIGDDVKNYLTVKSIEMSLCPCSKEMSLLKNNLTLEESKLLNDAISKGDRQFKEKLHNAGFGAHNQKSIVEVIIEIRNGEMLWIEDIIKIIKNSVSSETYTTLKRPDEKYVTEKSYMAAYIDDNNNLIYTKSGGPKFVEDISRMIAYQLNNMLDKSISDYMIIVNNQESIHSSDIMATSILSAGRRLK